jgi:hypothetical protein
MGNKLNVWKSTLKMLGCIGKLSKGPLETICVMMGGEGVSCSNYLIASHQFPIAKDCCTLFLQLCGSLLL